MGLRRERALEARERDPTLGADFARLAVAFFAGALRAPLLREVPLLEDFARVVLAFFAGLRLAAGRFAVERFAVDLRAPPLRLELDEVPELAPDLALAPPSIDHFPDITR